MTIKKMRRSKFAVMGTACAVLFILNTATAQSKKTTTPAKPNEEFKWDTVQAEKFKMVSPPTKVEACAEGGAQIGYIQDGKFAVYELVVVKGANNVEFRVSSQADGGSIEVRSGSETGPLLGTINIPKTGSYRTYVTASGLVDTSKLKESTETVYLVFKGGKGWLFNINWFKFGKV